MASKVRNPKNSENFLFKGLTKLLSGPITDYRRQNPRQLKRNQLDKYKFTSASGQSFKKSSSSPLSQIYASMRNNQNRTERYIDFDQMEYNPLLNAALDIYADEMTTSSQLQKLLNITCPNQEIKAIIEHLFYNIMNIEFNIYGWCRSMCKQGDYFMYLDIDEKVGIKHFIGIPPMEIERLEGEDKENPSYVQFQWNSAGLTLENWQVAHFRIVGNDKYNPYGTSVLEGARRISKQLQLLEDAMMAYRIVRSPERRAFYIDVGGIPEKEVEQYMQRIATDMRRNTIVDSDSGQVNQRYNALSTEDDFFIPVQGGQTGTRIESLPGGSYTGDVDDVKYLRDNMLACLKIPHSYLVSEDGSEGDKAFSEKHIEFARTIQRLQKMVVSELEKIARIHLYILGYRDKDLISFKLSLNNPSKIAEIQELEHWKTKFETAGAATEGYFSKRWVSENILNISPEEHLRNIREMYYDAQMSSKLEKMMTNDDMAGGGLDTSSNETDGVDLESELKDDEDETLLAAPGKRHDSYLTPGSKGKLYTPEINDKRISGARKRSMRSKYSDESSRSTKRNIFPGLPDWKTISSGISEQNETTYNVEQEDLLREEKILANNKEFELMMETLKKKSLLK